MNDWVGMKIYYLFCVIFTSYINRFRMRQGLKLVYLYFRAYTQSWVCFRVEFMSVRCTWTQVHIFLRWKIHPCPNIYMCLHLYTLPPFIAYSNKLLSICWLLKREWFVVLFQQELENGQQALAQTMGLTVESTWTRDLLQCNTHQVHYHLNLKFSNFRYMPY